MFVTQALAQALLNADYLNANFLDAQAVGAYYLDTKQLHANFYSFCILCLPVILPI
jgi:hypothetical protein